MHTEQGFAVEKRPSASESQAHRALEMRETMTMEMREARETRKSRET